MLAACRERMLPGSASVSLLKIAMRIQHAVFQPVDVELVLALQRDIDQRQARVKIQMTRPEAVAAIGCDRAAVGKLAVLETEHLQRAGIFRLAACRIIAARHQDRRIVCRRGADLVREDAAIGLLRLLHFLADGAIRGDPVHRDAARAVVGDQRVSAGAIERHMDRARGQRRIRPMRRQRSRAGIDAQRAQKMLVALDAERGGAAIAGGDIEERGGRMTPDVLHIG